MRSLIRSNVFWPLVALVALLAVNVVARPGFLGVRMQDGHLYGSLIDILRNTSPILLVAIGMTLVIATRGIDLSVGALVAIAGAVACTQIAASPTPGAASTVLIAIGTAVLVCLVLGAWNGFLVSVVGIQPIIATLILMTAGRGIAMLVTGGQITTVNSPLYKSIGAGYLLTLPVSAIIAGVVLAATALLTRRTALGTLVESVGINPEASRLAGVRARSIIWTVYVFSALCAAIAGILISSNVTAADANNNGLWIELDAILAVVIGGTSLMGGKFSLTGTLIGAFIIETLRITVISLGIAPEVNLVFKAIVVILVCLLQSPVVQRKFRARRRAVAQEHGEAVEVVA
ncbi:ABC transporter permease [Cellulomonas cellasea]|uniref:ABC transporter permease n=1 Tax=Cellulomonas cellasea TaxID=43670 RepID=UPI0025A3789C|nr:ABC transporter permease [Cellulomonas cellasea]MDM8085571.1 ABC transporter permease [Cellulomonas cellasea]